MFCSSVCILDLRYLNDYCWADNTGSGGRWHSGGYRRLLPIPGRQHTFHGSRERTEMEASKCCSENSLLQKIINLICPVCFEFKQNFFSLSDYRPNYTHQTLEIGPPGSFGQTTPLFPMPNVVCDLRHGRLQVPREQCRFGR